MAQLFASETAMGAAREAVRIISRQLGLGGDKG
jgi:hypothetical protein